MDKPLLPINKPEYILHNISVMLFLFFPESLNYIIPIPDKRISNLAFSPYVFSQKIHVIFGTNLRQKYRSDYSGYFKGF